MPSMESPNNDPDADLLEGVTFPNLRRLRVSLHSDGVDDIRQIQAFASHTGSSLESVSIALGTLSSLSLLLAHTPSVTDFELAVVGAFPHDLSAIAPHLEPGVLPQLENLQIEDPPEYPAGCAALVQMLQARCARTALKVFTLVLSKSTSLDSTPFGSLPGVMTMTICGYGGMMLMTGGNLPDIMPHQAKRPSQEGGLKNVFKSAIARLKAVFSHKK
ncbi:hypothetical protein C8R43DRAFT_991564 [Mycena crocata]|nr:hypothetical protein C8R43DRAFT_991564 [Mycena crocata]